MKSTEIFKQDKDMFIAWFSLYAIISFICICILFGIYISKSFNSNSSVVQDIDGNFNSQEINK